MRRGLLPSVISTHASDVPDPRETRWTGWRFTRKHEMRDNAANPAFKPSMLDSALLSLEAASKDSRPSPKRVTREGEACER
jgi:hypothetical protein